MAFLCAPAAQAQDTIRLAFPVDCTLGETCVIQQVMDRYPGPGAQDFRCGPQTYDGHQGTDIRLPDVEAMEDGVAVLAAAPGTVLGTRNTVPDTGSDNFPEGQDCGNGLVLDHVGGWQTQYCHMAQGSVSVTTGERVEAGQVLGRIGFSGNSQFPHLHLSVRHNGEHVDPFDPADANTCGLDAPSLWAEDLPLAPGGILSAGFADAVPSYEAIQAGTADAETLSAQGDAVVLWGFLHNGREGDTVEMTITSPDGDTYHSQTITLDRTQAQLFRASGRRIRDPLAPGDYTGNVTLIRDGQVLDTVEVAIPIR